jgi:hypothetical protein
MGFVLSLCETLKIVHSVQEIIEKSPFHRDLPVLGNRLSKMIKMLLLNLDFNNQCLENHESSADGIC